MSPAFSSSPENHLNWLPERPSRIAVGMSGGVDSSAIAYMLKEMGHEVVGLTAWTLNGPGTCCNDALVNAGRVCEALGCEFDTVDLRAEFHHYVMDYYEKSYQAGLTPNPCVECNRYVKWERLVDYAQEALNCEYIATGHYLSMRRPQGEAGDFTIHRAVDERKDQTYMLARVFPKDLKRALFPLGLWQKADVLAYAKERGIIESSYKESVDVCFVLDGQANYLKGVLGEKTGPIVDIETQEILGTHQGHWLFTKGQRKGLGVAAGVPIYVIKTDALTNTVYVGSSIHLESTTFKLKRMNWFKPPRAQELDAVMIKVRYAGQPTLGTLRPDPTGTADEDYVVTLQAPQHAITPGQIAAIYDASFQQLLGGGYIDAMLVHEAFDASHAPALPDLNAACDIVN